MQALSTQTAGIATSSSPSSTDAARAEHPVAQPPSAPSKRRRSEPKSALQMETLTQNYLVSPEERSNKTGQTLPDEEQLASTYQFSEPWDRPAENCAKPIAAVTGEPEMSTSNTSILNVSAETHEAAVVPEPPQSMPDTQQILDSTEMSRLHTQVEDDGDSVHVTAVTSKPVVSGGLARELHRGPGTANAVAGVGMSVASLPSAPSTSGAAATTAATSVPDAGGERGTACSYEDHFQHCITSFFFFSLILIWVQVEIAIWCEGWGHMNIVPAIISPVLC